MVREAQATRTGPDGAASSNGPSGKVGSSGVGGIEPNILAELDNTIVATNTADGQSSDVDNELDPNSSNNLFGTGGSGGLEFNPISDNFLGNIFNVANPGLAPLGDYGGPTQTVALLPGSPAIGAGGVIGFTSPGIDQRGFQRTFAFFSDIGAYQTQSGQTPSGIVVNTAIDGVGSLPGDLNLRQAINLAPRSGAATIRFDAVAFAAPQSITLTAGPLELSDHRRAADHRRPGCGGHHQRRREEPRLRGGRRRDRLALRPHHHRRLGLARRRWRRV